eukprot:280256_1
MASPQNKLREYLTNLLESDHKFDMCMQSLDMHRYLFLELSLSHMSIYDTFESLFNEYQSSSSATSYYIDYQNRYKLFLLLSHLISNPNTIYTHHKYTTINKHQLSTINTESHKLRNLLLPKLHSLIFNKVFPCKSAVQSQCDGVRKIIDTWCNQNVFEMKIFVLKNIMKELQNTSSLYILNENDYEEPPMMMSQWSCSVCTFLNHAALPKCEVCDSDRASEPIPSIDADLEKTRQMANKLNQNSTQNDADMIVFAKKPHAHVTSSNNEWNVNNDEVKDENAAQSTNIRKMQKLSIMGTTSTRTQHPHPYLRSRGHSHSGNSPSTPRAPKGMLRLKHTRGTGDCGCAKNKRYLAGTCSAWHYSGGTTGYVRCQAKVQVEAHMHDEPSKGNITFYLVPTCHQCNQQWGSIMRVLPTDARKFICKCPYRLRQTPFHGLGTYTKGDKRSVSIASPGHYQRGHYQSKRVIRNQRTVIRNALKERLCLMQRVFQLDNLSLFYEEVKKLKTLMGELDKLADEQDTTQYSRDELLIIKKNKKTVIAQLKILKLKPYGIRSLAGIRKQRDQLILKNSLKSKH